MEKNCNLHRWRFKREPRSGGGGGGDYGRQREYYKEYSHFLGVKTNNEAEYEAVIFGLRKIKALLGKEKIKIRKLSFGWIAS